VVDEVAPSSDLYRDEVFGPVLGVVRVDSFDEALALVNSHAYGNGAAIFTRDGALARRFQREASAGMIGVNVPVPVPVAAYSFGGWKQSLFGDAHIYGAEGLRFYTRAKVVTSRWVNPTEGVSLAFPRIVAADGDTGS
jgi:malonate-semialdehyde dehydrogenase (acetylating)/methylmalonate-semialdehyde dehydrogenase